MSSRKELAIRLIQDDLISTKFLNLLEKIELTPASYYLNLSETIILLMRFKKKEQEKGISYYLFLKSRHIKSKRDNPKELEKVAHRIYDRLQKLKDS